MRLSLVTVLVFAAATCFAQAPAPTVIDKLPFTCDKPGTYVLEKDLSANDSGILILAKDVVIDLGGHTLTYGAGEKVNDKAMTYNSLQSGNVGHHAIYVTSDPRASKDAANPGWNYRFTGVVIRNGTIKSGAGGISYSDAINVSGTIGCEIANLVFEMNAADSSAVIAGSKTKLHDCTFRDTNTVVSNRHAQLAVIVCGPETEVSNCVIDGGAQAGVKAADGSHVHHNDIRQNATATNCYGVQGYGQKDIEIDHNLIIPKNGRGIHCSEKSSGWKVHDNYVEPREKANKEYPKGMQTHGIKMEGCRNTQVYNNVVLCVSVPGGSPTPLNLDVPEDGNNDVHDNVFIAKKVTEKEHASAIYCVYGNGKGTRVRNNTFFTNDRAFECIWDAPQAYVFESNRFYRLSPEDKITTFFFWNAKPVSGFRFVDCMFGPGVSPTAYEFPDTKEDWPKDAEFCVDWTATLKVTSDGKPVPDAKVTAVTTKAAAGDARTYTTDAEGTVKVPVRQFGVYFHADTRKADLASDMPCKVKIDSADAGTYEFEVTIDKTSTVEADLKTKTHKVVPRKDEPAPDVEKIIADAKTNAGPRR